MRTIFRNLSSLLTVGLLAAALAAQTNSAARYDGSVQNKVSQELAKKKEFRNVQASVEDGIVTLNGTVELYQQKLDAAKKVHKTKQVQGVRNLIEVAGKNVPDDQLDAQLDKKLYYDRIGYDNEFNYVTASVKDGTVTLTGETRLPMDRDSALALVNTTPGVKDVINDVTVAPVSFFDDRIRLGALRAIYHDPVLSRYAIDPARPIRIVVENGHLTLCGTVMNSMDKQIAGIRAGNVFGAFSVQNDLQVAKKS
ncbi:MAG TPA: BON domain-containing protein [Terriglobales bacterium]|nr:BON domain-containing protein [Terriglobales bacterium]